MIQSTAKASLVFSSPESEDPLSDKLHLILDGGGYQRSERAKKAVH